MKTRTILLTGALALGAVGVATAAVNTCPMPQKPVHHVAAYRARPRAVTRRVRVLANEAAPSYAAEPPAPVVHEREYVAAAYPPPVYAEPYPAYYPGPYAYGPAFYYGGPYWGDRWGYGWHGGWRGGGRWRR